MSVRSLLTDRHTALLRTQVSAGGSLASGQRQNCTSCDGLPHKSYAHCDAWVGYDEVQLVAARRFAEQALGGGQVVTDPGHRCYRHRTCVDLSLFLPGGAETELQQQAAKRVFARGIVRDVVRHFMPDHESQFDAAAADGNVGQRNAANPAPREFEVGG